MTWEEMVKIEPGLQEMVDDAKTVDGSDKYFCANEIFYGRYKPHIKKMVGWYAEDDRLKGSTCYDIAYYKIWNSLPPCRECGCL